ncbi:MAG: hypothetical protein ABI548_23735 [Polyangiaceae bacterium]
MTGNFRALLQYFDEVRRIWKKWLSRRNNVGDATNNLLLNSLIKASVRDKLAWTDDFGQGQGTGELSEILPSALPQRGARKRPCERLDFRWLAKLRWRALAALAKNIVVCLE